MKVFSNEDLFEGAQAPRAWIWIGRVLRYHDRVHIGDVMTIRLPWRARRPVWWMENFEKTHQLMLVISHYKNQGPEKYRFCWSEVIDELS